MKKLCSVLLALMLILNLSTLALAANDSSLVTEVKTTKERNVTLTISTSQAGLKNGRVVLHYPAEMILMETRPLLSDEEGMWDLDAEEKGIIRFAWAGNEKQGCVPLLEVTFSGPQGKSCSLEMENPERAESQTVELSFPYRFRDVQDPEAWFYDAVYAVYDQGFLKGVGNDLFAPNNTMNRAMVVTILHRMAGSPETSAQSPFVDVPQNIWYSQAAIWAAEAGIVKGYGEGIFAPGKAVTRQELAAMFFRFHEKQSGSVKVDRQILDRFQDKDDVDFWAVDAMAWAVQQKVIQGVKENMLAPDNSATRAQTAQMVLNYQNAG